MGKRCPLTETIIGKGGKLDLGGGHKAVSRRKGKNSPNVRYTLKKKKVRESARSTEKKKTGDLRVSKRKSCQQTA